MTQINYKPFSYAKRTECLLLKVGQILVIFNDETIIKSWQKYYMIKFLHTDRAMGL